MKALSAKVLLAIATTLIATLVALPAGAHGTRSVTIDLDEVEPGKGVIHVRTSKPGDAVRVKVGEPCRGEGAGEAMTVSCPGSMAGAKLSVEGLGPIVNEAIVAATLHDGTRLSRVLTAEANEIEIPAKARGIDVARSYVKLGVAHILGGADHLLFLLALALLLKRVRAVIWAETAFTVSHSLSFSATALGLVHVSSAAAEACIALSLVLVALDIGRSGGAPNARHGAAVAFVFGLVHGLGFAGGLREIGLPDRDVAMALVGFAGGVEIGQVAFLAALLAALHVARRWSAIAKVESAAALLIGGLASYWLLERTLVCLGARA